MTSSSSGELPAPTTDKRLAKSQLDEFGYCLVANALGTEQVAELRARLLEQAAAEKQRGLAFEDGGPTQQWGNFRDEQGKIRRDAFTQAGGGVNQRVWMLVNKGRVFLELLQYEETLELVTHVLGTDYLLSSYAANIAKPGSVAMDLHTDQWWMPEPIRRGTSPLPVGSITRTLSNAEGAEPASMIAPPVVVNVMWMLNDFSTENGGTKLVPGSHLKGRRPNKEADREAETVAAVAAAGTAMVFDGRLWHGTGANVSDDPRVGVLTTFCGPQFRQQENYTVGTAPQVLEEASPELLALLGFKIWNAYGRTGNPVADFISPGESSLGEMHPEE